MSEVALFRDSMANGTQFAQDRNLFEMAADDHAPRGWGSVRMDEIVKAARSEPLSLRIWFSPATHPDDLGAFVEDRLRGLGWVQRHQRALGHPFNVCLWYTPDRASIGPGRKWHPDFPFRLAMSAPVADFLPRLMAHGWPERGGWKFIGMREDFWSACTRKDRRVPIGYATDAKLGVHYELRAVILDLSRAAALPWLVRSMVELQAAIERYVDLHAWIWAPKDKHYIWDPDFYTEPWHDGWLWPPMPPGPPVAGGQYSGLWCEPEPYRGERQWQEIRTDAVELLHDARLPVIHRIWRPPGIPYEEFFLDPDAYKIGWCR